ncbi:MAG: HAMP domain-containing sensor histidine kinase [Myxococcota bacterium]
MSSIRGIGDGYAFQRLLWLVVGTVVVPTILLSLFGVAAIRNQGAAVLHELDRVRAERLEIGARTLIGAVAAVEAGAVSVVDACASPSPVARTCAEGVPGTSEGWRWSQGEAVPTVLQAVGVTTEIAREGAPVWVTPVDGSAPIVVVADGTERFAWRLDPAPLRRALAGLKGDRLPEHVSLDLSAPELGAGSGLEALLSRTDAPALELGRPLSGWRLVLDDSEDPTRATLSRNSWLYPTSLVLLVGLVLVGTVFTLGSAAREFRLSQLQTDFVSSVSHELRTPLTAIALFVETLQSGRLRDPAKVQECLDLLAKETDRLSRTIERVLDWARMEAGRRSYDFTPVPVRLLADDAVRALRSQRLLADELDPIEVDVPATLPDVRADRDAIVEALLNLLQNAVKYTPSPRRIRLSVARQGKWVAFTVEDNGPGIAKRHRKRVFEKFYQADARLSAPTQGRFDRGSGLGLSIVRAVARAHGGKVVLDTELGRGSRFSLLLRPADALAHGGGHPAESAAIANVAQGG